jgi:hypothetical protein
MDNLQLENGFPVNPIRVGDGIVLINIFTLDPDKAELFVSIQVAEYKRLNGQYATFTHLISSKNVGGNPVVERRLRLLS